MACNTTLYKAQLSKFALYWALNKKTTQSLSVAYNSLGVAEEQNGVKLQNTKRDPRRICHRNDPRTSSRFTGNHNATGQDTLIGSRETEARVGFFSGRVSNMRLEALSFQGVAAAID
ncbi:hypothetical protein NXS19_007778 [Fusarium pseudograminearum]|nr:hypothetical protein NXS19_007778 [Fusarium pseudograminearum]